MTIFTSVRNQEYGRLHLSKDAFRSQEVPDDVFLRSSIQSTERIVEYKDITSSIYSTGEGLVVSVSEMMQKFWKVINIPRVVSDPQKD